VTCIISDVFCPTILTLVNNGVVNLVLDFQFPSALPIDLFICLSLNFSSDRHPVTILTLVHLFSFGESAARDFAKPGVPL
jgi:hypothetical protein